MQAIRGNPAIALTQRIASPPVDATGRTIWIADAHRDDGKRFVVRADEKLIAFVELESQLALKGMAF
jgi:hypothetical protein